MSLKGVSLSSSIEKKVGNAEYLYKIFGGRILSDTSIVHLLAETDHAIEASHTEMHGAGIAEICSVCDQKEGGSCCGAGLENRYDICLLLINLLLGVKLPAHRHDPKSCFFLAPTGCLLKARHVICVNYLCTKVTHQVDTQKIAALREREGKELDTLFRLHERIKEVMRGWTNG
jgi:hypothetical protein